MIAEVKSGYNEDVPSAEVRRTADWSEIAVDRSAEMQEWIPPLRRLASGGRTVLVYFNNHYAGYAPGSAEQFRRMWAEG